MVMKQVRAVKCPVCGKKVEIPNEKKLPPNFPFCSRRCKLIDLGNWLNEEYKLSEPLPGEPVPDDEN